ncbi:hypothetical protein [Streptomyces sp. NPDC059215]|uniref:hypothetical protein n=1 Tax=Streptomyces sp. NPDC059215 TaxID=3346772 RepID=UPI0036C932BA
MTEAADEDFWERVRAELASQETLLLETAYARNATRWHRFTAGASTRYAPGSVLARS